MEYRNLRLLVTILLVALLSTAIAKATEATESQQSLVVANFGKASATRWHAPHHAKVTAVPGWNSQVPGVEVNYGGKGGYALSDQHGLVTLGRYRWLSFWIKGDGRPHVIYLNIREGPPKSWDQFDVKFTVEGHRWKLYAVDLTRTSHGTSPRYAMVMRYFKSSKAGGADHRLTPGDKVTSIDFYNADGDDTLCFSDLRAWVNHPSLPYGSGKNNSTKSKPLIPPHPLVQPYMFAHTNHSMQIVLAAKGKSDFDIVIPAKPALA